MSNNGAQCNTQPSPPADRDALEGMKRGLCQQADGLRQQLQGVHRQIQAIDKHLKHEQAKS